MKKISLAFTVLFISNCITAQTYMNDVKKKKVDSVRDVHIEEAALAYPVIRQFSITREEGFGGNTSSSLYGKDFIKGQLRTAKTAVNFNLPILEHGKNKVVTSFGLTHQYFSLEQVVNLSTPYLVPTDSQNPTTLGFAVNYIRTDSLFGLPVTLSAGVRNLLNSSFSSHRIIYSGLASFTLHRGKNNTLLVGVLGLSDPSIPFPVLPFVSYFHHFQTLDFDLIADLPSRVALRKNMGSQASFSVMTELSGSNAFLDINSNLLPKSAIYSSSIIKSGLLFEYRLTKKAVFSVSGGYQSTIRSTITELGASKGDYFIKNSNSSVPYVQAGISLLPFFKGLRL